jgi:hypothetical protein
VTSFSLEAEMHRMSSLASMTWELRVDDDATTRFDALKRATDELSGEKMAAPRTSRVEQARKVWESYSAGGRPPDRRDVKALCWEPDVAISKPFLRILSKQIPLSRRAVRGLMASHHERWELGSRDLDEVLKRALDALAKSRGVVAQWVRHQEQLIGPRAPNALAESCLSSRTSVTERLSKLGVSTSSQFAMEAAGKLSRKVSEPRHATSAFYFATHAFFPEDNNIISPLQWGEAFRRLVTSRTLTSTPENRQLLIDLALKTRALGDPRLRVGQWQNVPVEARDLVIQWLSEEDLRFFFDLLMQDRADPQRRRQFWISYVNRALRSRVVVGKRDHARLRPKLDEIRARGRTYARMGGAGGANDHVSAFIMDFGEVTIVEFSQPNSACYIYENDARNPYLDFTQQVFDWHELKNREMGDYHSHVPHWHGKFRYILAQHGIRPE